VELLGLVDLARVLAERGDLAADRGRNVDPRVRVVRPEEVYAPDPVRREALAGQPWEGHRIAGRRIDRIDGRDSGRAMVGVVDAAALVEQGLWIGGQDRVGPEGSNLTDELLAQGEV